MKLFVKLVLCLSLVPFVIECDNSPQYNDENSSHRKLHAIPTDTNSPETAVPINLTRELFPQSGRYALEPTEEEYLQTLMYMRYDEGFYDSEKRKLIAKDIGDTLSFAAKKEGDSMPKMADRMRKDLTDHLKLWDTGMIERFKFAAGNSIIICHEILTNPSDWVSAGVDIKDIEYNKKVMENIRKTAIDEIIRRENENDL